MSNHLLCYVMVSGIIEVFCNDGIRHLPKNFMPNVIWVNVHHNSCVFSVACHFIQILWLIFIAPLPPRSAPRPAPPPGRCPPRAAPPQPLLFLTRPLCAFFPSLLVSHGLLQPPGNRNAAAVLPAVTRVGRTGRPLVPLQRKEGVSPRDCGGFFAGAEVCGAADAQQG